MCDVFGLILAVFRNIILKFSSHIVFYVIFCIYFICTQLVGTCCKLPCLDMIWYDTKKYTISSQMHAPMSLSEVDVINRLYYEINARYVPSLLSWALSVRQCGWRTRSSPICWTWRPHHSEIDDKVRQPCNLCLRSFGVEQSAQRHFRTLTLFSRLGHSLTLSISHTATDTAIVTIEVE